MCMQNINTEVTFFSEIKNNAFSENTLDLIAVNRNVPKIDAEYLDASKKTLVIKNLKFMLSINATEKIDNEKKPLHDEGQTPDNTVFFDNEYDIVYRLTETTSGNIVNLGEGTTIFPSDESENSTLLCRNIYSKKIVCNFIDVQVTAPPEGKDLCVLKIVIRRSGSDGPWNVQSMHPIKLNIL